ncbi:NAD-dependent epimerase/dehydratase family protein [Brevibacterium jeotgali]|uniref:Nucleoside-diphosphate-sugar epimerase n=1 Tax=Brevibacterium jeotgali TaxID=1262550 RepID=A0A2H1L5L8_9MICO|nr:NAD-dependent epimerase/dehydratase family protein [Brevibacterium jeotgali]TWC01390.1 nucleoside-diphosphate-sugar epimerase [Brevibacterium jeotgali]SMY12169.1 Nucleoside-diphosphate-sugar epimerase [Brevibacterium jeotgali]
MHYLVTGAGQIGAQLVRGLTDSGHSVTVLRRSTAPVPGAHTLSGDVADPRLLREAADGASAIFHCVHSSYDHKAWLRDLPHREAAVMDVAAELDIPVVFPESVYAYGERARSLKESSAAAPVSPLGEVRAMLLASRASHTARTISVIAADLIGPTANPQSSVLQLLVMDPAGRGRRAWIMGDPDAARTFTYIPDMTRAMVAAAQNAEVVSAAGDAVLTVPAAPALTQREMAADAARAKGRKPAGVSRIPTWALRIVGFASPLFRELAAQSYLWAHPSVLEPGMLARERTVEPTPWTEVLEEWACDGGNSPGQDQRSTAPRSPALRRSTPEHPHRSASESR